MQQQEETVRYQRRLQMSKKVCQLRLKSINSLKYEKTSCNFYSSETRHKRWIYSRQLERHQKNGQQDASLYH